MSDVEIKYALVIPAFNEAASISKLFSKLRELTSIRTDLEIIVVDNGSTDNTPRILNELSYASGNSRIRVVAKAVNTGYGAGLKKGFGETTAQFLIWTHADLQCNPLDVLHAINFHEKLGSNSKYIIKGSRRNRSVTDRAISFFLSYFNQLVNRVSLVDINAQPNLISKFVFLQVENLPDDSTFELYLLTEALRLNYEIQRFPVFFHPRSQGIGYNDGYKRKLNYSFNCIRTMHQLRRKRANNQA